MKFNFTVEQMKMEVWTVFFGSLVMDLLILFAGNITWLFASGFIFGTMSGRGVRDILINGSAAFLSSLPILFFFNVSSISGMLTLSGVLRSINIPLEGVGLVMSLSFIVAGCGAFAGSELFRHFLEPAYARTRER